MKKFALISLCLAKLSFIYGIDDVSLEKTLEVMGSVKLDSANKKWNFVCHVSLNQFKHILMTQDQIRVNHQSPILPGENIVFCAEDHDPDVFLQMLKIGYSHAVKNEWLVIGSTHAVTKLIQKAQIRVNQCVLFFNTDSGILEEVYWIGYQLVHHILAQKHTKQGQLLWTKDKNILKRRSDLHGLLLKATVHRDWPPLAYHTDWLFNHMKYVNDSKGALVHHLANNDTLGILPDIVNMLQIDTNFTTKRTVRKDEDIGFPIMVNGTFRGFSGMIGDLLSGEIDLILSPVVRTIEYHGFMTFFHRMSTLTAGLFVSAAAGQEDQDWLTYLLPFQYQLWILLLLNSLVAVMAIKLVQFLSFDQCNNAITSVMEAMSDFWMVLLSYFGRPSQSKLWWNVRSSKILILIIFLSGNLVFMTYKSALTSELAVRRQLLPFHSAKEFYQSDFK